MTAVRRALRGVMLDISGTLHVNYSPTPNAVAALTRLRATGVKVRFVTNSTKLTDESLFTKLLDMGFEVDRSEIFSSLSAAKQLITDRGYRPLLLLEDDALSQFSDIDQSAPHNAVFIGLAPSKLDYEHLNQAFQALLNGADLVGIHRARYFASSEKQLSLGPGPFVTALESATDKTAELVGKPARAFYQLALADMGLLSDPGSVAMVGDDVLADLGGGAQELGLQRYLVRTGKYRPGDEAKASAPLDGTFDSFAAIVHELCPT
ncbi:hypothetical protein LPJ77_003922 [Coemansia sp. RSA 2523]|nr:hypothetical protein LPJ54_003579 [Coemansia sp. RSA 1824]KAJ1805948.1 hypothetical protein LPJ77_003922 [Coemansia sp. RSA 2523]KAJ2145311.1 hypothetical protein IW142_002672 [Coemansia sp. RSA 564]KAJ2148216.1 hypothetical protein J3F82_004734 [Coemansia sp. RSA 637]KAJ2166130.1 hypothetical protein GGH16_004201 [Coemansia sp. RSA 560]KAJ2168316.1 hypothetical protein GGH15_001491 [Coemansia sp. RSA 562]KAJ2187667.1 hypothetical protein EV181_002630 [Coemansia sp. RSA 532]KAJ2191893.1 h